MKSTKKIISLVLSFLIVISCAASAFAYADDELWQSTWEAEYENGVILFPGSDESEMNVSWYSATESKPQVIVSQAGSVTDVCDAFEGYCVKASGGDYANKVTITGLEPGKTYDYYCISDGFKSQTYTFKTDANPSEFSAVYMTDIHISHSNEDPESIKSTANKFNSVMAEAVEKYNPSLLISAGDQASEGYETEYKGLSSCLALKSIPVATSIGNHDRKGVEYATFNNVPNEYDAMVSSYVGGNYWYTRGNVLFLHVDTNNASGMDHRRFVKEAVEANPDVKWRVMVAHHDLYSGRIPHRESENELLRLLWAPICDEFAIDLFLLGHSHYYTVTNVLYNNKTVADYAPVMTDNEGTVYMVSGSITRPRDDEDIGLNEEWIGFANVPDDQAIYNILDFTEESITVSSYYQGNDEAFNSFEIVKTSNNGGHPDKYIPFYNSIIRFIGTIYAVFNNINVYSDLTDNGFEVNFFDVLFG